MITDLMRRLKTMSDELVSLGCLVEITVTMPTALSEKYELEKILQESFSEGLLRDTVTGNYRAMSVPEFMNDAMKDWYEEFVAEQQRRPDQGDESESTE